jgi:serine/threonine protein kinase/outer membrane protein assembly factor BamB
MFSRGDKLESGHYTIIKEIGVGGMGVVYHCRDEQLLRDVAVKMLLPELMADKSNLEVFRQEARLAAQLEHPNVVTVYDIGVEERQKKIHHYVCMEYLPGGNLANRVISGPLAVEHCLNWMKQLASGLTYAHKRGVVHQDIKADNIFITNEGDLKIGDFGLARLLVGRVHYNAQNKGMGTPAYMSPELCRGEPQDHRSDIYSLGVLFFEMATGQLPFRARGMIEMATKHSSAPIPSAKRINPLIPEILDKVIRRMMAKTPEERYSSMSEVLTILDDLIFELRVARLGLGNRPLLRSGNIQAELLAHAQNQAQWQAQPTQPEEDPADLWKAPDPSSHASPYKPDTEPHTTSLPRSDPKSTARLAGGQKLPLSASEQLIAQLESNAEPINNKTIPFEPTSSTPTPRNTPRNTVNHFHQTQQVHPPASHQEQPPQPSERNRFAEHMESSRGDAERNQEETSTTLMPIQMQSAPAVHAAQQAAVDAGSLHTAPGAVPPTARDFSHADHAASDAVSSFVELPAISSTPLARPEPPAPPVSTAPETPAPTAPTTGAAATVPEIPVPAVPTSSVATSSFSSSTSLPITRPDVGPRTSSSHLPKLRFAQVLQTLKPGLDLQWIFRSKGPIGWSSPVLDKEEHVLFVGSSDGTLYALDAATGSQRWATKMGSPILSSPILQGEKIMVVGSSGLISALSARDGSILWRFDAQETIVATPNLIKDMLIVPTAKGRIFAIETNGGLQRWQFKSEDSIVSTPHKHADMVVFGSRGGDLHALNIDSGRSIWKFDAGSPIVASPAVSVDSIYVGTEGGTFFAVEAESGGLIWEYPTERPIVARAVIAFTSVMFCSHDKWMYCCERYDGGLRWKGALRGRVVANPIATKDTVLSVTREGWIQSFATSNGELRWQRDLGRCLESQPVVSADRFFISTVEGEVIAYSMANATVLGAKSA